MLRGSWLLFIKMAYGILDKRFILKLPRRSLVDWHLLQIHLNHHLFPIKSLRNLKPRHPRPKNILIRKRVQSHMPILFTFS